jgi:hypothetical protein
MIPVRRIFDVEKAKAFYLGFPGFRVEREHRREDGMPMYMQVPRDHLVLHLTEHRGDCGLGASTFAQMKGPDAFHARLPAGDMPPCDRASNACRGMYASWA